MLEPTKHRSLKLDRRRTVDSAVGLRYLVLYCHVVLPVTFGFADEGQGPSQGLRQGLRQSPSQGQGGSEAQGSSC